MGIANAGPGQKNIQCEERSKSQLPPTVAGLRLSFAKIYDRQGTAWSRYLKSPSAANDMTRKSACCNSAISAKDIGRILEGR